MNNIIQVGMAELKIASAPRKLLTAGLGSCIGICVCSPAHEFGVLAHIMLPSSTQSKRSLNKAKFADTAIEMILEEMMKKGASAPKIIAKIAGGAQMFKFVGDSSIMNIGQRNTMAVEEHLQRLGIKVAAKDTGGNFGRTIVFDPKTGDLTIRTIGHGERTI